MFNDKVDESLALEISSLVRCLRLIYADFCNSGEVDLLFYFGVMLDDLQTKLENIEGVVLRSA